jgi:2-phosphosulfolactate phosphatase
MKIDVYALPSNVQEKELKERVAVVIDVLRASSTIITALHNGCREVIPLIDIEEAINLSKNYERGAFLLGGERNAQKIEGFDLSNSPYEYTRDVVKGRTVLITTTNGTRAIRKAGEAKEVIIGGFLNVGAVTRYIGQRDEDVAFICAGTEGKFSLDDILAVGAMLDALQNMGKPLEMDDLGLVCLQMYSSHKQDLRKVLERTYHYRNLVRAGFESDVDYCIQLNLLPTIPVYREGVIRVLETA